MLADLHTHTTASDGQYAPAALVEKARAAGIGVLAVTDHDCLDGLDEAVQAGDALGVRVVRGVELCAQGYGSFHILGYAFSPAAPVLRELCEEMRRGRDERKYRLLALLREQGVELTLREVEDIAGGAIIARPHFAQALVRRGYVATVREAFDRYLDTPAFHERAERHKPEAETCLDAIHAAGGKASLAHPYQLGLDDAALEALLARLAGHGLDAIECLYPRHSALQTAFYKSLAKKYNLHITGGSDFHGERVKPDIALTPLPLSLDWLLR